MGLFRPRDEDAPPEDPTPKKYGAANPFRYTVQLFLHKPEPWSVGSAMRRVRDGAIVVVFVLAYSIVLQVLDVGWAISLAILFVIGVTWVMALDARRRRGGP